MNCEYFIFSMYKYDVLENKRSLFVKSYSIKI